MKYHHECWNVSSSAFSSFGPKPLSYRLTNEPEHHLDCPSPQCQKGCRSLIGGWKWPHLGLIELHISVTDTDLLYGFHESEGGRCIRTSIEFIKDVSILENGSLIVVLSESPEIVPVPVFAEPEEEQGKKFPVWLDNCLRSTDAEKNQQFILSAREHIIMGSPDLVSH